MTDTPTCTEYCGAILALFPPETSDEIAGGLKADANVFAQQLGQSLDMPSELGALMLSGAFNSYFSEAPTAFAESLSDDPPWDTLKELIGLALEADADERRSMYIAPDGPVAS
jgi:hypothetical protein